LAGRRQQRLQKKRRRILSKVCIRTFWGRGGQTNTRTDGQTSFRSIHHREKTKDNINLQSTIYNQQSTINNRHGHSRRRRRRRLRSGTNNPLTHRPTTALAVATTTVKDHQVTTTLATTTDNNTYHQQSTAKSSDTSRAATGNYGIVQGCACEATDESPVFRPLTAFEKAHTHTQKKRH
jgi:hypothetical protein